MTDKQKTYVTATFKERMLFGFEGFTAVLMVGTMMLFFQPFCTGYLGLPAATPGAIYLVIMIIDAITDPIFGILVDRYSILKSRKYSPWYYAGVVLLCVGGLGVFWFPNIDSAIGMTFFVFAMYAVQTFGNTFITVSIGPLRNLITTDPAQRSTLPVFSSIPALAASVLVVLIPVLVKVLGTERTGYRHLLMIFSILGIIAGLFVVRAVREKDSAAAANTAASSTASLRVMWEELRSNKPLQMLLVADTTNSFAGSMVASSGIYFYKYVLGDINLEIQPIVSAIGIVTGLAGAFVAAAIAKKRGRKNAYVLGTIIGICIPSIMLIVRPFKILALFIAIMSLGSVFGGLTGNTKWVMIADCVDYGFWKTGRFVPAVYNSIFSFITKLSLGLAGGAISLVLGAVHFVDNNLAQPQNIVITIMLLQFLLPILGHVCSLFAMKHYEIDMNLYQTMMSDIAEKKAALEEQ